LLPGSLTGKDIFKAPAAFQDKIFLAYATAASDHTRAGVQVCTDLQRQHGLSRKHLPAQIAAYVAAKVLVEGLKRTGRTLSRATLIATLEKMHAYETGLTPRLTYGPNRHIGALGAHILALDLAAQWRDHFKPQWACFVSVPPTCSHRLNWLDGIGRITTACS
jgi:ABC-type branched-subunit amino acid transport system substrate-binding protein